MSVTPESVWEYLQEVGKKLDKVGEEIRELSKETEKKIMKLSRETEKKIKELSNLFTTQWGKLIETLVEPGAVNLFKERGIKVRYTSRRIEVEDEEGKKIAEFDIFLEDEEELVVIEVKTTVKKEDVEYFLEKLSRFKEWLPKYKKYKVYGAIAGLRYEEGVDRYAYKKGLFVLKSEGGLIKIANDEKFSPKIW